MTPSPLPGLSTFSPSRHSLRPIDNLKMNHPPPPPPAPIPASDTPSGILDLLSILPLSRTLTKQVTTLVWLGSQATKPLRIALALFFAPATEVLLASTERRLRLPSRQAAFGLWLVFVVASTATLGATAVAFAAARSAAAAAGATATATATSSASPKAASAAVLLLGLQQGRVGVGGVGGILLGFRQGGVGSDGDGWAHSLSLTSGSSSISDAVQPRHALPGGPGLFHRAARISAAKRGVAGPTQCTTAAAEAATAAMTMAMQEDSGVNEHLDAALRESAPTTRRLTAARRMSPQKAADRNPPPQDNIHGWKEHPNHLLGFWEVGRAEALPAPLEGSRAPEAIAAAAASIEAAAALAAKPAKRAEVAPEILSGAGEACNGSGPDGGATASLEGPEDWGSRDGGSVRSQGKNPLEEAGGFSFGETADRDIVDLGSDVLHHVEYVVFKRDGTFKAGPAGVGVSPRSWRFAPANRRILFEVDVPARGVTLR